MGYCTCDLVGRNVSCLQSLSTVLCSWGDFVRAVPEALPSQASCDWIRHHGFFFPTTIMATCTARKRMWNETVIIYLVAVSRSSEPQYAPPSRSNLSRAWHSHLSHTSSPRLQSSRLHQQRHAQPHPRLLQDFHAPQCIYRPSASRLADASDSATVGWAASRSLLAKCLDCPRRLLEVLSC